MPKRNREDAGKLDNDQRTLKTESVNNQTPEKVDVVKTSKLESYSDSEIPTQKEDASRTNASVVNSTEDLQPIEDEKSATFQNSETNNMGANGDTHNAGTNDDTEQNLEEKQGPLADDSDNPRRASNDPREVKKMQRKKELGIND